jgi:hypothetical protein
VALYVEEFSALVDQLSAYEASANPLYYAMRFVDGLQDDIRSIVMIQRPSNLDSACALAHVHEEALESGKKANYRRYEPSSNMTVHGHRAPLQFPPKPDKAVGSSGTEDHKAVEAVRLNSVDDKFKAHRQYRRARGLCDHCAKKWSYDHKCAPTVQLHAIQEMWDLMPEEESIVDEGLPLFFILILLSCVCVCLRLLLVATILLSPWMLGQI